jgi:hypothetical protein
MFNLEVEEETPYCGDCMDMVDSEEKEMVRCG